MYELDLCVSEWIESVRVTKTRTRTKCVDLRMDWIESCVDLLQTELNCMD